MPVVFLLLRPNKVAGSGPGQSRYGIVLPPKGDEGRSELSLVNVGTWKCLVWELKPNVGALPDSRTLQLTLCGLHCLPLNPLPTGRLCTIQKVLKDLCHAGAVPASQ